MNSTHALASQLFLPPRVSMHVRVHATAAAAIRVVPAMPLSLASSNKKKR